MDRTSLRGAILADFDLDSRTRGVFRRLKEPFSDFLIHIRFTTDFTHPRRNIFKHQDGAVSFQRNRGLSGLDLAFFADDALHSFLLLKVLLPPLRIRLIRRNYDVFFIRCVVCNDHVNWSGSAPSENQPTGIRKIVRVLFDRLTRLMVARTYSTLMPFWYMRSMACTRKATLLKITFGIVAAQLNAFSSASKPRARLKGGNGLLAGNGWERVHKLIEAVSTLEIVEQVP
jgi:hypothetical protein